MIRRLRDLADMLWALAFVAVIFAGMVLRRAGDGD